MVARWLYFRLFGLTAAVATGAYWVQLPGLNALAPIADTMKWLSSRASFWDYPSLLWLSSSSFALQAVCGLCVVCSLLVMLDVAVPLALAGLFVGWVSLVSVAQPFLSFQWDILLCEAALLSVPYALWPRAEPTVWARLLVALPAVKVTFESGVVKLTSQDPSWWPDLTALTYHYWTQPLPAWTSRYIDRLPVAVHKVSCLAMFALELGFPLLAFGPRRMRTVAAGGMIALQLGLAVAGNYAYFNLLVAVLCVPLLELKSPRLAASQPARPRRAGWVLLAAAVASSALIFGEQFRPGYPAPVQGLIDRVEALKALSSYGVFRVMTKTRPEIIVEGSADGVTWKTYELEWKPGRLDRRPEFIAPWQPRLDWQMWFAALGECGNNPWLVELLRHLLLGTPEVLALMAENPFPQGPPRFVRTTRWQYRFAAPASADWWVRADPAPYCPTVTLDERGGLQRVP